MTDQEKTDYIENLNKIMDENDKKEEAEIAKKLKQKSLETV